eukprot:4314199-Pleurochrysis_carterae.AAC.6
MRACACRYLLLRSLRVPVRVRVRVPACLRAVSGSSRRAGAWRRRWPSRASPACAARASASA